jgi:TatD DNase family protein
VIDSHTHLSMCDPPDAELVAAAVEAGVERIVTVGTDGASCRAALAAAEDFPQVYAAIGRHPNSATGFDDADLAELEALAAHDKCVAIGETGLDYYRLDGRSVADMEWQRERFRVHIRAAQQCGKPLIIHTRSASDDTMAILKEEGEDGSAGSAGGVFHCFTETAQVARAALDLGFHISFSGILTFKNAADLREVARFVPLDRMLIETDSPYLAPVPYRGKTNNPSYVPYVARQIGELRGMSAEAVGEATSRNFEALFKGVQA